MTKYPDDVVVGFGPETEVLTTCTEALPPESIEEVAPNLIRIDLDQWKTWPWEKTLLKSGHVLEGHFARRDDDGNLLFMCGADAYQFNAKGVEILEYGPDADLSLAWDIDKTDYVEEI